MITLMRRWLWRLRGFFHFSTATARVVAVSLLVHFVFLIAHRVDYIYNHSTYGYVLQSCFGLNWPLLSRGFVWQPVTYMFIHDGWLHLFLNMWACAVFGGALERDYGARTFRNVFFLGGVFGAFGWLGYTALLPLMPSFMTGLSSWLPEGVAQFLHAGAGLSDSLKSSVCIGASGGVFALLGCYFALYPERQLYVLLFFIIPLRLKARSLMWLLLAITFIDWIFIQSPLAHSSHLAGGVVGYLLGCRLKRRD